MTCGGPKKQKCCCYCTTRGSDDGGKKLGYTTSSETFLFSRKKGNFQRSYRSWIFLFYLVARGILFFELPFFVGTPLALAATDVEEQHSGAETVAALLHPETSASTETQRQEEEEKDEKESLSPRIVRVAIIGGGISGAAAAIFLSLLEKQLHYERIAKQQYEKTKRPKEEDSSTDDDDGEGVETSSEIEDDEETEEDSTEERWWMKRPIKFQLDVYEASERYGGRMEYGDVAGRTVELGDVGVNASNFWMTVFHDLLNEFADTLGGTGWTTPGDDAAAAAETLAATFATTLGHHEAAAIAKEAAATANDAVAEAHEEAAATASEALAAPQDTAATPTEAVSTLQEAAAISIVAVSAPQEETAAAANGADAEAQEGTATADKAAATAGEASATMNHVAIAGTEETVTAADKEIIAADERTGAVELHSDEPAGRHTADILSAEDAASEEVEKQQEEKNMDQDVRRSQKEPSVGNDSNPSAHLKEKETKNTNDHAVKGDGKNTARKPASNTRRLLKVKVFRPNPKLYTKGWKQSFTFPAPLTEFQGISPGPTVLLHDSKRVTPIASLTLALIKSGATVLAEPLKNIALRWQRIYDYTFGGSMCAKRAAISLFPGRGHYIAPHPSRQLSDGRPYCSVVEQARSATTTGVGIAEALGLEKEIQQPFSALLKSYPIERVGVHLIDSLIRGVYAQRARHLHTLAGALAIAGTFEAPYDRKRYSGRVLVEFLLARVADNSFLRCPIAKVIELEDEIVSTFEATDVESTAHPQGGENVGVGNEAARNNMNKAEKSSGTLAQEKSTKPSENAFSSSADKIGTKRRKRYKVEPANDDGCSNPRAREHLENTIYDFVIVAVPLEDSPLTLYRRNIPRQDTRGAIQKRTTAPAAENFAEAGARNTEVSDKDKRNGIGVNRFDREDTELLGREENTVHAGNTNSAETNGGATGLFNVDAQVQSGQPEAVGNSSHESGTHQLGGKYQGKNTEGHLDEPQWSLKEVIVPERPYVTAQTTCAAADGLVKFRTQGSRVLNMRYRSEWSGRSAPTTVLTSDSLSDEYFSFGELFVATCHRVVDSELDTPSNSTPMVDEGRNSLLVLLPQKEEDFKEYRQEPGGNAETHDGEKTQGAIETIPQQEKDDFPPGETARSEGASGESAVRNWKLNAEMVSQLSSARLERQEKDEEASSGAKTLYYTGTPVTLSLADGFFSRIKGTTSLSRHLGQTICCALTADELDDRDVTEVFRNVSHLERRAWNFARPKMYPLRDKKKRKRPATKRTAQTYVWGEKEEKPPPTLRHQVTNFVLMENVYYPSAFENVVSCAEGAVMSAKNVANLVIKQILENYDD